MDMANIKRIKMKIGRVTAQLIEECTAAEPTIPGSVAAAQDVKKIVDKAFELVGDDTFGGGFLYRCRPQLPRNCSAQWRRGHLRVEHRLLDDRVEERLHGGEFRLNGGHGNHANHPLLYHVKLALLGHHAAGSRELPLQGDGLIGIRHSYRLHGRKLRLRQCLARDDLLAGDVLSQRKFQLPARIRCPGITCCATMRTPST